MCVTATVAALRPMAASVRRIPADHAQRTRRIYSQQEQPGGYEQGYAQHSLDYEYAQQGQPQLPYPWEQREENGAIYYYNSQTGQSSWDPPQQEGYQQDQDQYGGYTTQHGGGYTPQDDHEHAGALNGRLNDVAQTRANALNDVAWAEEALEQSALYSPCSGPSMEALEALEAADERLAAIDKGRDPHLR